MRIEATVLEGLTAELTQLADALKEGTERNSAGREFVNGLYRDLYALELALREQEPTGDQAAWLEPFLDAGLAKLDVGRTLFPDHAERLEECRVRLLGLKARTGLLSTLREEALPLLEAEGALHPQAWALLERGHVLDVLRSPRSLRGRSGAGPGELAFAGRLLEGLGLQLSLSEAAERPGPRDEDVRSLVNRIQGWLEEGGASAEAPRVGQQVPEDARKVEAGDRLPELPRGAVKAVVTAGWSLGGVALARPVCVVSPGVETHLAAAVRAVVHGAADALRTQVEPRVRALTQALYKRLDDPQADRTSRASAALDLIEAVRPILAEDQQALGSLLEALGRDFGDAKAELILPSPGTPMAPDPGWQAVDVFSPEAPAGEIVALLRPGLRLSGEVLRPALVQVSQGEPPPGALDEVLELLPEDDARASHIRARLERARCLSAGDAGAALARELADLSLQARDDVLGEAGRRAMRLVLDDPPAALAQTSGWEAVREFLSEHLETLFEDGENGELTAYRLVRPYYQALRTAEFGGARLRSLGEAMDPLLNLFDEALGATARTWLFGELERLGGAGLEAGGHARRLLRTAAKALKRFHANGESTAFLELTQALTRSGFKVYPEDGERLELCPEPDRLFHRLEAVYDDAPRFRVLGVFDPCVTLGEAAEARESGAVTLSLGPEPAVIRWLRDDAMRASRLGPATARLAKELTAMDRQRLLGELKGDAGTEWRFAQEVADLVTTALRECGWRRADEERHSLGRLFELLHEDYHLDVLPGYLSYRRLRELVQKKGSRKVAVEIVREGAREITLDKIGAIYRDELLLPLAMRWCTGPPPEYVTYLKRLPWFAAVLAGKDPGVEMPPGVREAIQDFESPDAVSLEGVVNALSVVVTWLAQEQPHLLATFTDTVKNAPGLELTFFPLPAQTYAHERLLQAVDLARSPDALEVVRDAGREEGYCLHVERIGVYQKGRLLSEEPRARFAVKTLPRACEGLAEALKPVLQSPNVTGPVKSQLKGFITRLALVPEGEGQTQVELQAFKALLTARLVDPGYAPQPDNALHKAGAYLSSRLESKGLLQIERFEGKKTLAEALQGHPADVAEVDEVFCPAGRPELAEVKRPLVFLEGNVIQRAFLMRGVATGELEVLELDGVLVDCLDRLRSWQDGPGALVDSALDETQRTVIPRTIKRIEDTRKKMFEAHAKGKPVLPPDTQRRDLVRFVVDQVHRSEDGYALLEDKSYRGAFGEMVFKDVVFRSASPYLSKNWNISIDTSVVAGADTQALVGKFKKESTGPRPKRENMKVYSVLMPCYSQDGVTIRPAVVRVGDYD